MTNKTNKTELTIEFLDQILDNVQVDIEKKKQLLQKDKTRCYLCRKKVGLIGIECRCGYIYCGSCRGPDKHGCSFDYLTYERDLLAKANVKVTNQIEQL